MKKRERRWPAAITALFIYFVLGMPLSSLIRVGTDWPWIVRVAILSVFSYAIFRVTRAAFRRLPHPEPTLDQMLAERWPSSTTPHVTP